MRYVRDIIHTVLLSSAVLFAATLWRPLTLLSSNSAYIQVQSGHTGEVKGIAQSPGGSMFATISIDNTVRLWSTQKPYSGVLLRVLKAHARPVIGIAWNNDDTTMIATHSDDEVFLWNIETGQSVQLVTQEMKPVSLAFQSSNTYISVACRNRIGQKEGKILRFDFSSISGWKSSQRELQSRETDVIAMGNFLPRTILDAGVFSQRCLLVGAADGSIHKVLYNDNTVVSLGNDNNREMGAVHSFVQDLRQGIVYAVYVDGSIREVRDNSIGGVRWVLGGSVKVQWVSSLQSSYGACISVKNRSLHQIFLLDAAGVKPITFAVSGKPWVMTSPLSNGTAMLIENSSLTATEFKAIIHIGKVVGNSFSSEQTIIREGNAIRSVAIDPLGRYVLSGDNSGNIVEWDIRNDGYGSAKLFVRKKAFSEFIHQVIINDRGTLATVSGQDPKTSLKVYDCDKHSLNAAIETEENQNPILMSFVGADTLCTVYPESIVLYNRSLNVIQRKSMAELGLQELRAATMLGSTLFAIAKNGSIVEIDIPGLLTVRPFSTIPRINGEVYAAALSKDSLAIWHDNDFLVATQSTVQKFDYGERVTGLCCNIASKTLYATLDDGSALVWQKNVRQRGQRRDIHDSKIQTLILASVRGNNVAVSGSLDGAVGFVNLSNPSMAFYGYPFFLNNSFAWATYTSDRRYDAEHQNTEYLRFVSGLDAYSLGDLYNRHYTPHILSQFLNVEYKPVKLKPIKQPPLVRIVNKDFNKIVSQTGDIYLTAEFTVRQSGLARIYLYQNGKLLEEGKADFSDSVRCVALKTFEIHLAADTNRISVKILDNDSTFSSDQIVVVNKNTVKQRRLYVLSVGVNKYKDESATLRFARNDAESVSLLFNNSFRQQNEVYDSVVVRSLYDESATKSNVMAALRSIAAVATENDAFVFYFAGHGQYIQENNLSFYSLALHKVQTLNNKNQLVSEGLLVDSLRESLHSVRATRQLVVLDACYSGKALASFEHASRTTKHIESMSRTSGAYVVASVQSDGKAKESSSLQHGVFTHSILVGLNGAAPRGNKNYIDVLNLCSYLAQEYENGNLVGQKPQLLVSGGGISHFVLSKPTP